MTITVVPARRRAGFIPWRAGLLPLLLVALGQLSGAAAAPVAALPAIDSQTSLLIVSPHPDDETLCCAGLIRRVVAAGGHVGIVWLTSGDGSELDMILIERALRVQPAKMRDLAGRRMREARAAAGILGVRSEEHTSELQSPV